MSTKNVDNRGTSLCIFHNLCTIPVTRAEYCECRRPAMGGDSNIMCIHTKEYHNYIESLRKNKGVKGEHTNTAKPETVEGVW
jgi:hypothetical protein